VRYPARIIYGDTDSVMVDFGPAPFQDVVRYGQEAARMCTERMPKPNQLLFETVKLRSLFENKKRYAALQIEGARPGETYEQACARATIECKGMMGKRRDNAPLGSEMQLECLERILRHNDVPSAAMHVKQTIADLLMDRIDMSRLVITKGLSKTDAEYERGGTKQQHTELKKRIEKRARTTGEVAPQTGDRVPYVLVDGGAKSKAFECAESPLYALKHGCPIDVDYYLQKQIMAATLRLFTCVWEPARLVDIKSNMPHKRLATLRAYQQLFAPALPHMRQRRRARTGTYGIGEHARALPRCLAEGCGVLLGGGEPPRGSPPGEEPFLCAAHARAGEDVRQRYVRVRETLEAAKKAAWDTCRVCAGGGFDEVTCSNMTCPNFFHRQRTLLDIEDVAPILRRVGI
jgi:DNA polymerase delta subunit 1